ncbi:DUF7563 family protein [Haladaptatus sp. DFWS20]|uniref:DUF7563 family protein n=1 Tax=Haladaptatus sp. DFWS20 TaxID=3403467 RepID=UPI003EBEECDC
MAKAEQVEDNTTDHTYRRRMVWEPRSDSGRYVNCQNPACKNEHVAPKFVRTFGADGVAYACPECTPWAALKRGAAADPKVTRRVSRKY